MIVFVFLGLWNPMIPGILRFLVADITYLLEIDPQQLGDDWDMY